MSPVVGATDGVPSGEAGESLSATVGSRRSAAGRAERRADADKLVRRSDETGMRIFHVNVQVQVDRYIDAQDPPKRDDIEAIQRLIFAASPNCKLWFLDGRNSDGKIVTNENIGYGTQTLKYADGGTREFYRIGLSSNKAGISLYLMGLEDRKYLPDTYGGKFGKAKVTGYCVRFRRPEDVNLDILE